MAPLSDPEVLALLAQLRDIHLPTLGMDPSHVIRRAGWGFLVIALAGAFFWAWRRRRYWRELFELRRLHRSKGREIDAQYWLTEVSAFLRRCAMARFDPMQVAGLVGEPWLTFLDATGGNGGFRAGPGRILLECPYCARVELSRQEAEALVVLIRQWLRANR